MADIGDLGCVRDGVLRGMCLGADALSVIDEVRDRTVLR
jgi:hypothetical protein